MSKRYLWKFHGDCGRQGDLYGLFAATEEEVSELIGRNVYFGEVLGKHSDISGTIEEDEITKMELDTETVEKVSAILGDCWSGYDPRNYVEDETE